MWFFPTVVEVQLPNEGRIEAGQAKAICPLYCFQMSMRCKINKRRTFLIRWSWGRGGRIQRPDDSDTALNPEGSCPSVLTFLGWSWFVSVVQGNYLWYPFCSQKCSGLLNKIWGCQILGNLWNLLLLIRYNCKTLNVHHGIHLNKCFWVSLE